MESSYNPISLRWLRNPTPPNMSRVFEVFRNQNSWFSKIIMLVHQKPYKWTTKNERPRKIEVRVSQFEIKIIKCDLRIEKKEISIKNSTNLDCPTSLNKQMTHIVYQKLSNFKLFNNKIYNIQISANSVYRHFKYSRSSLMVLIVNLNSRSFKTTW